MAAPEEGDSEAPPPPPPAEDKPPGGTSAACGAPLSVAAEEEDGGGSVGPANPSPLVEGPELQATAEELVQSLAAMEAGSAAAGTVLYVQEDGSVVEGERLSAVEVRLLLEQLLAAAESPGLGKAEPPPTRYAATPLAPAEVQRVIEQVSKAQEKQKLPPAAPPEPCLGPPPPLASIMHNAAQQLQSVAQQVARQQGSSVAATRLLPQKVTGAGKGGSLRLPGGDEIHCRGQASGGEVSVDLIMRVFSVLLGHTCPRVQTGGTTFNVV